MKITKRHIAMMLSKLKGFEAPKAELEQYETPSEVAAELLWSAFMNEDISGKKICDLGCGTGILSIGAGLLGAEEVKGFDIDEAALKVAEENLIFSNENFGETSVSFEKKEIEKASGEFDTVIMNPPFGVQVEHADRDFVVKAFELADVIYSIHKSESKNFLKGLCDSYNFEGLLLDEFEFKLKATMEFHKEKFHSFKVGIWKFSKR